MDGFANSRMYSGSPDAGLLLSRLDPKLVAPYWAMAQQYTLADKMFPTEHGPSWTSHLNLIAGTTTISPSKAIINFPTNFFYDYCGAPVGTQTSIVNSDGTYGAGPYPCFRIRTLADSLDEKGVSWRYYAPNIFKGCGTACGGQWSPVASIKAVKDGPDWANVVNPPPQVLNDIAAGKLAAMTWVVPESPWSDHAFPSALPEGPSWVASIVNAIGQSKYWNSTAIVVLWDEWGGFYDNAVPPQLDFRGLGIRVPCIIISPYARHGYVSHTQYEYGSILRFAEQVLHLRPIGLQSNGYTDTRATSIIDSFDFTQQPSTFQTIDAPYPPSTFLKSVPSGVAPDDD
jgi:phospholipase C